MKPGKEGLRSSAIRLAIASGVEYGLQLAIPIILVRYLDVTSFGQYRLMWLLAGTALAIAPAYMPQSLFYFLPRAAQEQKTQIIGNVLVYLLVAGCTTIVATSNWNTLLPSIAADLFSSTHGLSAVFIGTWVVASMLDVVPTADGRAKWQANSTITISIVRTLLLAAAAIASADIVGIAIALLVVAIFKLTLLVYYLSLHLEGTISWQISSMKKQLMYSLPFAVGNALFLLRIQADQWVVASMLTPAMYAIFSIASVLSPIATLIRMPVYNAMMPHLNSAHARGDSMEIARLIARSNGATALLLIPIAGGLFVVAPELIKLVYTNRFQDAAPIMQVYLLGMMLNAFAVGHVLAALNKARVSLLISIFSLVVSITLSVVGVLYFGMIGAAFGSVFTLMLGEVWALQVVAHSLNLRVSQLLDWPALWPTLLSTLVGIGGSLMLVDVDKNGELVSLLEKTMIYLGLLIPAFLMAGGKRHLSAAIGWR